MNRSMDDLLRDTLRAGAADSTAVCVDAETAAAFVDGTLSTRERASAEAHIADCARCQAVVAALVRSTPPLNDREWWRRPAMVWLVPATAAAAAVAIWINVPDSAAPPPAQTVRSEGARLDSSPIQPQVQPQIPAATSRLEAAEAVGVREAAERLAKPRSLGAPAAPQAAAPPAPVALPDAARADAATSVPPNVETVTVSGATPAVVDTMSVATFRTALSPIVSSNRVSQWRVGTSGEVQHSADGGKSWRTQATGVKATAVAGSSPSPTICWLVGPGGLVLLTTDEGRSWRRLPFPADTDLASVRATDDRTATIVSVEGRSFTTSDAGRSWRQ
jgi:hypothetical protein